MIADEDLADLFGDGDTSKSEPKVDLADLFDDVSTVDTPGEPEPSEAVSSPADPPGEAGPVSLNALVTELPEHWQVVVRAVLEALVADREAT